MSEGGASRRGKGSGKWSTLRNAFLSALETSKVEPGDGTEGKRTCRASVPVPRFEGFMLFPRHEEDPPPAPAAPTTTVKTAGGGLVLATYDLPDGKKVTATEVPSGRGAGCVRVTLDQLFAHRVHGVDNTGNVRVWPAEQVLLHLLLSSTLTSSTSMPMAGSRVLELGAGMSGLAGLGFAACSDAAEVVITDGNPDALKNLEACVELNARAGVFGDTKVSARRLVWDSLDGNGDRAALLESSPGEGGRFDLVIASDCLFFKDFHNDLISTIGGLLKPGGRAVLVQPQRGGTVNLFMERVAAAAAVTAAAPAEAAEAPAAACAGRLEARLLDRYDDLIWSMHQEYLGGESPAPGVPATPEAYHPDEHQPLLVEMIKTTALGEIGGGDKTAGASLAEPSGSAAGGDQQQQQHQLPWISWSGALPETIGQKAPTGVRNDGENADRSDRSGASSDGGGSGGGGGAHRSCVDGGASAPLLVEPKPPLPPSPSSPGIKSVEAVAEEGECQEEERPDQQMTGVYDTLAERLLRLVRERRGTAGTEAGTGAPADEGEAEDARAQGEGSGSASGETGAMSTTGGQQYQQKQLWVAVAGAPGSGKTTLAAEVCRRVQSAGISAACLPMDGYHLYRRELDLLPDPEEAHRRRGAHWTFDGRRFLREMADARRSGRGSFPGFDHAEGDPVENEWTVLPSHAVVIVEGNYLLLKGVDPWDGATGLFDETWAIRCPPEVCGERVRRRHVKTGLREDEARARVEGNDLPNAELVSERCPWEEVDVIVDSL